jgi:hypothetical protein
MRDTVMKRSISISDIPTLHEIKLVLEHHVPLIAPEDAPRAVCARKMGTRLADPLDQHSWRKATRMRMNVSKVLVVRHHKITRI